jgi:hypothetical protein
VNIWQLLAVILVAGAIGGTLNALISDNGFFLPSRKRASTGVTILRPGFLGNIIIGSIASGVFWSLYGPLSTSLLFSSPTANADIPLSSLGTAIIVGIGGAKWLTDAVDKRILRTAATIAAEKADSSISSDLLSATPINMLEIIEDIGEDTKDDLP